MPGPGGSLNSGYTWNQRLLNQMGKLMSPGYKANNAK
jgi:hypothetical protein